VRLGQVPKPSSKDCRNIGQIIILEGGIHEVHRRPLALALQGDNETRNACDQVLKDLVHRAVAAEMATAIGLDKPNGEN
jgi:hypothetical protein